MRSASNSRCRLLFSFNGDDSDLLRGARLPKEKVAVAIQLLLDTGNVAMNRPAVEAGLSILLAGGDFADGVIAYEGCWLGGETFVSLDKKAISLPAARGQAALLL